MTAAQQLEINHVKRYQFLPERNYSIYLYILTIAYFTPLYFILPHLIASCTYNLNVRIIIQQYKSPKHANKTKTTLRELQLQGLVVSAYQSESRSTCKSPKANILQLIALHLHTFTDVTCSSSVKDFITKQEEVSTLLSPKGGDSHCCRDSERMGVLVAIMERWSTISSKAFIIIQQRLQR